MHLCEFVIESVRQADVERFIVRKNPDKQPGASPASTIRIIRPFTVDYGTNRSAPRSSAKQIFLYKSVAEFAVRIVFPE